MLVVCSGSMLCNHNDCPHKRTHYALHMSRNGWGRRNCATRRCTNARLDALEDFNFELYFECVPWEKGIEKTFVHPRMSVEEILENTRWYDLRASVDGYMDLDPDPDLGPEDDAGRHVPASIVMTRGVSTARLESTDPPWPGKRMTYHEGAPVRGRTSARTATAFSIPVPHSSWREEAAFRTTSSVLTAEQRRISNSFIAVSSFEELENTRQAQEVSESE